MKYKIIIGIICLALTSLMFVGCKDENDVTEKAPCTHSYINGVCVNCGEADHDYKPGDGNGEENGDGSDSGDNSDAPTAPDADLDGETDLPFVPA